MKNKEYELLKERYEEIITYDEALQLKLLKKRVLAMIEEKKELSEKRSKAGKSHKGNQYTKKGKKEETPKVEQTTTLKLPVEEYNFLNQFFSLEDKSTAYLFEKNKDYMNNQMEEIDKLIKDGYDIETIKTVLAYIKQDEFRCKNIKSIGKLRKKNKEGVPYIVVMLDKIKSYVPRVAILK